MPKNHQKISANSIFCIWSQIKRSDRVKVSKYFIVSEAILSTTFTAAETIVHQTQAQANNL